MKNKIFTQIISVICLMSCRNIDQDINRSPNSLTSNRNQLKNTSGDTNIYKLNYLKFHKIEEIFNYKNDDVLLVSEKYYPNIAFDTGGYVTMMFNAPDGVEFRYKLNEDKISVFYMANELFNGTNSPPEGALLFEISLTDDTTFNLNYYHESWIDYINSKYMKSAYDHPYFPTTFHAIKP